MAPEHEDQTHRAGYYHRINPHHSAVGLPRFQLWEIVP